MLTLAFAATTSTLAHINLLLQLVETTNVFYGSEGFTVINSHLEAAGGEKEGKPLSEVESSDRSLALLVDVDILANRITAED